MIALLLYGALCSAGAVIMAASLVLTGRMTARWEFYLYYALVGSLGLAATGQLAMWCILRFGWRTSFARVASSAWRDQVYCTLFRRERVIWPT